jgi:hypothetical protein
MPDPASNGDTYSMVSSAYTNDHVAHREYDRIVIILW